MDISYFKYKYKLAANNLDILSSKLSGYKILLTICVVLFAISNFFSFTDFTWYLTIVIMTPALFLANLKIRIEQLKGEQNILNSIIREYNRLENSEETGSQPILQKKKIILVKK